MAVTDSEDFLDLLVQPAAARTGGITQTGSLVSLTGSSPFDVDDRQRAAVEPYMDVDSTDIRLQTIVFEALSQKLTDRRVSSLMHVLGWADAFRCFAIAGYTSLAMPPAVESIQGRMHDLGVTHCLVGGSHDRCIVLIAQENAVTPETACTAILSVFTDDRPVCLSAVLQDVSGAARAIHAVSTSLDAAPAIQSPHRPMHADDLLPERALLGDEDAREELYSTVYAGLRGESEDDPALMTVYAFLNSGSSLDATARELNVHPNTVRYRLRRAAETTGWDATDPREAYVLQTAIALGRIRDAAQGEPRT